MNKPSSNPKKLFQEDFFIPIDAEIIDQLASGQITRIEFDVLCILLRRCNYQTGTWRGCAENIQQLIEQGKTVTLRYVQEAIKKLADKKHIIREQRSRGQRGSFTIAILGYKVRFGALIGQILDESSTDALKPKYRSGMEVPPSDPQESTENGEPECEVIISTEKSDIPQPPQTVNNTEEINSASNQAVRTECEVSAKSLRTECEVSANPHSPLLDGSRLPEKVQEKEREREKEKSIVINQNPPSLPSNSKTSGQEDLLELILFTARKVNDLAQFSQKAMESLRKVLIKTNPSRERLAAFVRREIGKMDDFQLLNAGSYLATVMAAEFKVEDYHQVEREAGEHAIRIGREQAIQADAERQRKRAEEKALEETQDGNPFGPECAPVEISVSR